jgi:hypothetical protein
LLSGFIRIVETMSKADVLTERAVAVWLFGQKNGLKRVADAGEDAAQPGRDAWHKGGNGDYGGSGDQAILHCSHSFVILQELPHPAGNVLDHGDVPALVISRDGRSTK